MFKTNAVNSRILSLLLVFTLALVFSTGCGKKDGTDTKSGDDKKTETIDKKDDGSFSRDTPFMVEFEVAAGEKGKGTVTAIYAGKRCLSTSSFDVSGKKMTATAYFDGGDVVYTVSDFGGMKTGFKFDKKKYSDSKDNVDVNSFRDYLDQMEKIGEEEIIGYKCEIYKHKEKNFTVSLYEKTVPLRMGTPDGKTTMKATKFEKNVKVTDDMFKAPTDVKYTDMSTMLDNMKKGTDMKDLKDLKDKTKELEELKKKYSK
jgi:hypothetical protein